MNKDTLSTTILRGSYSRQHIDIALRNKILSDAKFLCVYCGDTATVLDHVIPASYGGRESEENLVASCDWCNSKLQAMIFDDGVDGKRLYISQRLHLKRRRDRRKVTICGDCADVFRPSIDGATEVLCNVCALNDELGLPTTTEAWNKMLKPFGLRVRMKNVRKGPQSNP